MIKLLISISIVAILIGCSGEHSFDATYLNDGFQGITYMNEFGEHNGSVDLYDWKFVYGSSPIYSRFSSHSFDIVQDSIKPDNVLSKLILSDYKLFPAYPNPTNYYSTISFSLPTNTDAVITIVDNNYNIVWQYSGSFEAGVVHFAVTVDQFDSNFRVDGIYRVYVDIGDIYGYGDILVMNYFDIRYY